MKKALICLMIVMSMLFTGPVFALAEPAEGQKPILDVIRDQGDVLPTDNIYNTEKYDNSMEGYDISQDFMMKVYPCDIWGMVEESPDSILSSIKADMGILYVVFRENIFTIRELKDGTISKMYADAERQPAYDFSKYTPTYIRDILNSSIYDSKLHMPSTEYSRVLCFDGENNHLGTFIYYISSEYTIVRYYDDHYSEGIDLMLPDFQVYALAHFENMIKYGHLDGGASFSNFVKNNTLDEAKSYYEKTKAERLEKENQTENNGNDTGASIENSQNENTEKQSDKDSGMSYLWWIVPAVAVVVVFGGVIVFLVNRKKKT